MHLNTTGELNGPRLSLTKTPSVWRVHSARAGDAQTAPSEPEGGRPMVPGAPARPCGRATKDPQRQTSGPLPILGTPDELPGHREVLSDRKVRHIWRTWLSRRTRGAKMTWEKYESLLRQLPCCHPESCIPGLRRESGLRNPLRAICTVGSVREEKSWRSR